MLTLDCRRRLLVLSNADDRTSSSRRPERRACRSPAQHARPSTGRHQEGEGRQHLSRGRTKGQEGEEGEAASHPQLRPKGVTCCRRRCYSILDAPGHRRRACRTCFPFPGLPNKLSLVFLSLDEYPEGVHAGMIVRYGERENRKRESDQGRKVSRGIWDCRSSLLGC